MIDELEKTVHDDEAPGLNNFETYVSTLNRFNTFSVLSFSDLNRVQIYKMPYKDSPLHENEILMSFNFLYWFKPNGQTEHFHIRKPNYGNFFFEIED